MSRNKYPEETVKKILDVSMKLFLEKGYEHTTVQDIIDNLGGLTKGAVYHHFKSKDDIMLAVINRMFSGTGPDSWAVIRDSHRQNAVEKLRAMIMDSLSDPREQQIRTAAPDILDSPRLLSAQMKNWIEAITPDYILPVIKQGVEEGTIKTQYPRELAELSVLIMNIFCNPAIMHFGREQLLPRLVFTAGITEELGLCGLFDEEMMSKLLKTYGDYLDKQ